jgi:hypothetical protein
MKNLKYMAYIVSFLAIALFIHCNKETVIPPVAPPEPVHLTELGKMEVLRDGKPVKTNAHLYFDGEKCEISTALRIVGGTSLAEGITIEEISFSEGKYDIFKYVYPDDGKPHARLFWSVIDELIGVLRSTDDFSEDYIEIIKADTVNKTIEGRFQFHLKNVDGTDLSPYGMPDSLYFSEGVFYLKAE